MCPEQAAAVVPICSSLLRLLTRPCASILCMYCRFEEPSESPDDLQQNENQMLKEMHFMGYVHISQWTME